MRARTWLIGIAIMMAVAAKVGAERQVLEAILVRVNDRIVTISEFRQRLEQELAQRPQPTSQEALEKFANGYLQSMVDEMVLLERANEKHVTIDDAQVDESIKGLREVNGLTDDKQFEQALASAGLTVEGLRDRYRQTMTVQRTVQSEVKPTEITEEEVHALYEKQHEDFRVPEKAELEQLFFPVTDDGSDRQEVLGRARGLVQRVRSGADLKAEATLAGVELQSLGAIPIGDLREELRDAIADLPAGGLTDPLTVPGGFQVLRLVQRIPAGYQPFEEVRETLRRNLSQKRFQEQTQGLVERLKKNYLVEVHEDLLPRALTGLAHG
jgi:peptidyl-prolyl cis-trans isomerase SurA